MSNSIKNTHQHPDKLKDQHHKWAKGVAIKSKLVIYHPYTRKDFVFDSEIK